MPIILPIQTSLSIPITLGKIEPCALAYYTAYIDSSIHADHTAYMDPSIHAPNVGIETPLYIPIILAM
jgi:hypothetical protein